MDLKYDLLFKNRTPRPYNLTQAANRLFEAGGSYRVAALLDTGILLSLDRSVVDLLANRPWISTNDEVCLFSINESHSEQFATPFSDEDILEVSAIPSTTISRASVGTPILFTIQTFVVAVGRFGGMDGSTPQVTVSSWWSPRDRAVLGTPEVWEREIMGSRAHRPRGGGSAYHYAARGLTLP